MLAVGLMSGTSLDGIDAALVKIEGSGKNTNVKLIDFLTLPMKDELKRNIKAACSLTESNVELICSLNFSLGYAFADAVLALCKKAGVSTKDLDFIASHGQTIYHLPKAGEHTTRSTLQIGEAAIIAYQTNTKVISNFRVMDMAAGGEGAPLVPYSEMMLYAKPRRVVALQNIGGIGNVSVLPGTDSIDDIYAFDTGPGNMMIDEACQQLLSLPYDDHGHISAKGNIIKPLLNELLQHPYMAKQPPKSTGREAFGQSFVNELLQRYQNDDPYDIIATLTSFTAQSIAYHYKTFIGHVDEMIIGGGGAHNDTLVNELRKLLPETEILLQEDVGYSSDAKEAIAFVILGNETLHGHFSNVKSATGASASVILGTITPAPKGEEHEI